MHDDDNNNNDDIVRYPCIVQILTASMDSSQGQICVSMVMLLSTVQLRVILPTMKIVLSITSALARVSIDVHAVLGHSTRFVSNA